ncbi:RNA polymerase sigma factor [Kribbella flavida]|uniref:RNA polymerase sigma factor n=1 Tax=Kribbella flavida TaxID=182640 RepID=UPI00019BF23C|nr:sigma-70 family RNA polymerase sigma factor [Kribbella flavida]
MEQTTPGGQREFEQLYRANYVAVLTYATRRTADAEAARDVVSEVFEIAWRRRDEIPSRYELPWLYRVAANRLGHRYRSDQRELQALQRLATESATDGAAPGVAEQVESAHALADVTAALGELGVKDQQVLLLNAWEGLTGRELAVALGCSTTAAGVRLHRARRRLRSAIGIHREPSAPSALRPTAAVDGPVQRTGHSS